MAFPEYQVFGPHLLLLQRQLLLFWLGLCIREESLEKIERFVLSPYRAVSADQDIQSGSFNDEIRVSLLTFPHSDLPWRSASVSIKDFCTEAPLLGFICEAKLFRDELLLLQKPLFSASAIPISSSAYMCSGAMQNCDISASSFSARATRSTPAAILNVMLDHLKDDPPALTDLITIALIYAIDAGNEKATELLLARSACGNAETKESIAQLSKSKRERAKSFNTHRLLPLMDRSPLRGSEAKAARFTLTIYSDRFLKGEVFMTPMFAATSLETRNTFSQRADCSRRYDKTWAAQVIRCLFDLGSDFKPLATPENEGLHVMVAWDPLYQLIKYQIRDVKQRDIEDYTKKLVGKINTTRQKSSAQNLEAGGNGRGNGRFSDQGIAEEIIAENLKRWKPFLDEVLEPDNDRMQKDQIELTISALANSARAEVLPVIFYLVDVARFDIKRPLLAAGRHNGGPLTHQLEEFFQSNYACSLALMKKGVRMPLVSVDGDGLEIERDVAVNHQSTHMSQVNLVLKRHAERAEALVGKLAEDADAALCVTTELAQFCMSEDVATKQVELAETLVLSLELTRRDEELCRDSRSADGIVPVASSLPAPGVLAEHALHAR